LCLHGVVCRDAIDIAMGKSLGGECRHERSLNYSHFDETLGDYSDFFLRMIDKEIMAPRVLELENVILTDYIQISS
jgi:hypothetical protein